EPGVLYIDGHVTTYTGRKHRRPKTFVQKRRQCQPASTDTWVHNGAAEPLFFVTSPINQHLLALIEQDVIPQARRQIGAHRTLTLVFDREAWSPESFRRWHTHGVEVITYRGGTRAFFVKDTAPPEIHALSRNDALSIRAERIYAPLKSGFYGLHSILLCLVMMALLRIKSIERLSAHQPGELGI
ncbi:MAG: hypothetical protein GY700_08235, partial [Propionibacteriaceae bacterium]|nr:hypothetical protein [Propionibacteriaceae bacterium]